MVAKVFDKVRGFYETNRQGLFTYALSLVHDTEEAEDAVQAAVFGLLRRDRLPRNLRPYVFRSIRNAIIDAQRSNRTESRAAEHVCNDSVACAHPIRDRALCQCLGRLADNEREPIVLRIYAGLTFAEIAAVDGSSINTVASRYRRGLEKMRHMLDGES